MESSEAIKQLRTRQGLSQQAFAVRMGLAIRSVARYEAGGAPRQEVVDQFIQEAQRAGFSDVAETLEAFAAKLLEERAACVELAKHCIRLVISELDGGPKYGIEPRTPEQMVDTLRAAVKWLDKAAVKRKDDAE